MKFHHIPQVQNLPVCGNMHLRTFFRSGQIFEKLLSSRTFRKITFSHVKKITRCHGSAHEFPAFMLLTISLFVLFLFLYVSFFSSSQFHVFYSVAPCM